MATSRGSVACCASWVTGARCLPQPTLHQRANPTAASRPMAASNHVLGACALRRFTHSTAGATRAGRDNRASPFRLTLLLPWDNVAAEPVWYINRLSSPFVSQMTATNRSVSIVVSIPACHAGDLGSIPRRIGISHEILQPYPAGVSHLFPFWGRSSSAHTERSTPLAPAGTGRSLLF